MKLAEFITQVSNFDALAPREKIQLFAWHLHTHEKKEVFANEDINYCFRVISAVPPEVSKHLSRMAEKKQPDLVRARGGYKLEGSLRRALDTKYGAHPSVVVVSQLLTGLPDKIPNLAEREFLAEAINCYRVGAYRAAIVMTWNLAFDHLLVWIMADAKRLADFTAAISRRYPKRAGTTISKRDDFEEFKEFEIIEICNNANLFSKNVGNVLSEKLKRRNVAAHPSGVVFVQSQADDAITDLCNNVVLTLK
jgi:hypothetical protein